MCGHVCVCMYYTCTNFFTFPHFESPTHLTSWKGPILLQGRSQCQGINVIFRHNTLFPMGPGCISNGSGLGLRLCENLKHCPKGWFGAYLNWSNDRYWRPGEGGVTKVWGRLFLIVTSPPRIIFLPCFTMATTCGMGLVVVVGRASGGCCWWLVGCGWASGGWLCKILQQQAATAGFRATGAKSWSLNLVFSFVWQESEKIEGQSVTQHLLLVQISAEDWKWC